jgi:hypothetical protein
MNCIKSFWVAAILMFVAPMALAQGLHSKVEAKSSSKDGQVILQFSIKTDADNVVNDEAPWKFELKKFDGLKVETPLIKGSDLVKTLPLLTVKATPTAASGTAEWSLVAFVCSKDKSNCFRDVHNGTLAWKK